MTRPAGDRPPDSRPLLRRILASGFWRKAQTRAGQYADDPRKLLRTYCDLLARETGIDEAAIWEWGFLERVTSGLYCIRSGLEALGRKFLASAERLSP